MKDKTKELADSVGAVYPVLFMGRHDGVLFTETELETFVELVAEREREICAKLCEGVAGDAFTTLGKAQKPWMEAAAKDCAAAIRARGTT